eukprot:TRINITY_DN12288_c0_g1_i1.p1 TRINITY_DN12288_c0_g1~~TRINITY_DN12288_c0_g1_i1.p1  ORF type:complete len:208 (-),score=88.99 TRINITY_DN12288_c0_g1_i1:11-598(-)
MFTARKKLAKKEGAKVSEIENQVAQALFDLESGSNELKNDLRDLAIASAREVESKDGKTSVVIFVPYRQHLAFRRIQQRLVRELEKKFSGKHVVFVTQRRIQRKPKRGTPKRGHERLYSRTIAAVSAEILNDLVYPSEIVGKRTRYRLDGSSQLKVLLDRKNQANTEYKLDTFTSVFKRLTGTNAVFEYPVQQHE